MNAFRKWLLIASAYILAGCAATQPKDPLAARQKAYERLTSFLEPGMTRRQVYALLPPARIPTYRGLPDSELQSILGLRGPFGMTSETHPLDSDFELQVSYLFARSEKPVLKRKPRSGKLRISAHAIDILLFGDPAKMKTYHSKQDLDDQLFWRPSVVRKGRLESSPKNSLN